MFKPMGAPSRSMFLNYELTEAAERALYRRDWATLRGWAVTTAIKEGDPGLVAQLDAWIAEKADWLRL